MYWEEDKSDRDNWIVPDDVVDLVFNIKCKMLPLDHAHAFSNAMLDALPWMNDEDAAGIHLIHGAESGNGWYRPENAEGEVLHLSKRAKMSLRVPKHRIDDAAALVGQTLDIEGYSLEVGKVTTKLLTSLPTLFARYVVAGENQEEEEFLELVVQEMAKLEIPVRKIMCGRAQMMRTPEGPVFTRSVMVADVEREHAVLLQQRGIGPGRKMGCGLFLPHKGIAPVGETQGDE